MLRTIRYVASLVWIMILLQHCHSVLNLNIGPSDVSSTNCEQEGRAMLPPMAFGTREWEKYMGALVGEEPPLPTDIDEILDADCPFLLDGEEVPQKVKDNHVLVLIPTHVNGEPFTLDNLGALVKAKVFPQNEDEYGYGYYSDDVRKEIGSKSFSQVPYWMLLTKRVIEGSLGLSLSAHEAMIEQHGRDGYSMPYALEAATAMLTHYIRSGEHLYSDAPWRYTRCRKAVDSNDCSVFVGGFDSSGLRVDDDGFDDIDSGVAGCRKF